MEHFHHVDISGKASVDPINHRNNEAGEFPTTAPEPLESGKATNVPVQKDLRHLQEELSWQLLAAKKCSRDAKTCVDERLAAMVESIGAMHERHFRMFAEAGEGWMGARTDAR